MKSRLTGIRTLGPGCLCAALVIALAGCGDSNSPPPAAPPTSVTQTISAASGGTINGPGGIELNIPPDALSADTAITIALDDSGAPPLPGALAPLSEPMIALLPHGTSFSVPVTLSLPAPATPEMFIYKTNPQRDGWEALVSVQAAGRVEFAITGFSQILVVACVGGPPFTNPACGGTPAALPQIIGEPRDSFVLSEGPCLSCFWIFRVDVIARAPYTFRWMRNGAFLPNETNQDILINPTLLRDNGARYSVMVTDALGRSVTSRGALLTVNAAPPTIVNQPADVQATVAATAFFTAASTSSIVQTLQWKRCDAAACPTSVSAWPDVPGQTSTQLTLPGVTLADSGARVAMCASNAAGTTCSNTATLTVLPAPTQPLIVTPPQPVTVAAGASASFTVVASGGSLSFDWQGSRDGVNFTAEPRCTDSATCTLSNVALGDDGLLLQVRVFNSAGTALSAPPALLTTRLAAGVALARVGGNISYSLGLRNDGRVIEWGANSNSLPGTPVVRQSPLDVATIATGNVHSLAIRGNGEVFAWGSNTNGQLGDGTTNDSSLAQIVPNLAAVRSVAAGVGQPDAARADQSRYSLAVTAANGLVYGWGTNLSGQLGIGSVIEQHQAVAVGRISGVAGVAAGGGHALARRSDGSVWVWGRNTSGQLGTGNNTASLQPIPIALADIVAVAAGSDFSVALRNDGTVFTWGQSGLGKLGDGSVASRSVPTAIALPAPAVAIATGVDHAVVLLLDGRVYAWGRNDFGQTGTGSVAFAVGTAQRVVAPLPANIVAIGTGAYHSLALDGSGNVWGWGLNSTRQLFDGTALDRFTPVQVQGVNLN